MSYMKRRERGQGPAPDAGAPLYGGGRPGAGGTENQWQQSNWYDQTGHAHQQQQQPNNFWQQQQPIQQPQTQQTHIQQQQQHRQQQQTYNQQYQYGYYNQNNPSSVMDAYRHHQQQQQQQQPISQQHLQQQQQQPQQQQHYNNREYGGQGGGVVAGNTQQQQNLEGDGWGSWGWGDEDNSNNVQQHAVATAATNVQQQQQQQQGNNVATVDGFANEGTWSWGEESAVTTTAAATVADNAARELSQMQGNNKIPPPMETSADPLKLSPLDHLSGKRKQLSDTPQWSLESQMSQESSDDILQTSESDKSHNNALSRSSTISHSPISGGLDFNPSPQQQQQQLPPTTSHHQTLPNDDRGVSPNSSGADVTVVGGRGGGGSNLEVMMSGAPPPVRSEDFDGGLGREMTTTVLPTHRKAYNLYKFNQRAATNKLRQTPPLPPPPPEAHLFPLSAGANLETVPDNSERPDLLPPPPPPPSSSSQQSRSNSAGAIGLEGGPLSQQQQQWPPHAPDNNEVAAPVVGVGVGGVVNDRNQYLETGQLSSNLGNVSMADVVQLQQYHHSSASPTAFQSQSLAGIAQGGQNQNQPPLDQNVDVLPPPGLRRLVLGQMEGRGGGGGEGDDYYDDDNGRGSPGEGRSNYFVGGGGGSGSGGNGSYGDDTPTFSRMVPGQLETSPLTLGGGGGFGAHPDSHHHSDVPAMMQRMVPGESSSPESSRQFNLPPPPSPHASLRPSTTESPSLMSSSASSQQLRSETIGADASPRVTTNQRTATTIGADYSNQSGGGAGGGGSRIPANQLNARGATSQGSAGGGSGSGGGEVQANAQLTSNKSRRSPAPSPMSYDRRDSVEGHRNDSDDDDIDAGYIGDDNNDITITSGVRKLSLRAAAADKNRDSGGDDAASEREAAREQQQIGGRSHNRQHHHPPHPHHRSSDSERDAGGRSRKKSPSGGHRSHHRRYRGERESGGEERRTRGGAGGGGHRSPEGYGGGSSSLRGGGGGGAGSELPPKKSSAYDSNRRRYKRYDDEDDDADYYSDRERDSRKGKDPYDKEVYDRRYHSLHKKDRDRRRKGGGEHRDREREYAKDPSRKGDHHYYGGVGGSGNTGRYDNEYDAKDMPRSRASSRSDSLHESYRDRDRDRGERERDRHHEKEHRERRHYDNKHSSSGRHHNRRYNDPYNPYAQQGYGYDVYSQYYQQYQYYENLRKTNPEAYAQLYRKYYQGDLSGGYHQDKTSVHSGRSSANDELAKERYARQSYYDSQTSLPHIGGYYRGSQTQSVSGQYSGLDLLNESSYSRQLDGIDFDDDKDPTEPHRLTPAKFATAHLKAAISSGLLVKVLPHYPVDGQPPTVELSNLDSLLSGDEEYETLKKFPGPLAKGVTHKKTIIEYCEGKIRSAVYGLNVGEVEGGDVEAYVLMWELLILLIKQNGMVVGTDIAELLLKNSEPPKSAEISSISGAEGSSIEGAAANSGHETAENHVSATQQHQGGLKEEEVTNKFREYLLYGSGKEALEWAMKHGLWGHALFLASKLDKRTYANVLMRFANGLTMNDPLQTLYQLLSGRMPAAVTCVADEKWGDWRPHLAMILSNSSQRPEVNCRAITTMGDTLMGRGSLFAAQFCYLMAEVGFGAHGDPNAKLVLLGASHLNGTASLLHFATNEAIHMTEIYEYACSLNDANFVLPEIQLYKYILATRLADMGLLEKSLSYLERIAVCVARNPSTVAPSLIDAVISLADRLKYYDPVGDVVDVDVNNLEQDANDSGGAGVVNADDLDVSRPDNSWLKELRDVRRDFGMGLLSRDADATLPAHATNGDFESQHPHPQQVSNQMVGEENQPSWQQLQEQQLQQQQQNHSLQPYQQQWGVSGETVAAQSHPDYQHRDPAAAQFQEQQQQYWSPDQQQSQQPIEQPQWGGDHQSNEFGRDHVDHNQQTPYYGSFAQSEPVEVEKPPKIEPPKDNNSIIPQPQITMPNQQRSRQKSHSEDGDAMMMAPSPAVTSSATSPATKKAQASTTANSKAVSASGGGGGLDKTPPSGNVGWFGGIFSKLSLKPKNQMKLPDDKNPSIVWDSEKKRWINTTDEDGGEGVGGEFRPPPKMADFMPPAATAKIQPSPQQPPVRSAFTAPSPQQQQGAEQRGVERAPDFGGDPQGHPETFAKPPLPNMFKLQRDRNLKKSYIDVFNPNSAKGRGGTESPQFATAGNSAQQPAVPQMNFFIPKPVNDPNAPMDFLTPSSSQAQFVDDNAQMSRWSSASSLSREVQSYTMHKSLPRR